ncbi:hypothetical protein DL89DRAFT_263798 [Linderina pennispora]|uniref:Uncharacterized protein n=1 Tax=Linderina pennispora TaxID=61395 RepID=A0A1Y1WJX1_9FUNG|nr:uncharacterized protein DL89DRAFT_263798 [Linderina pennispora]ORX73782.1 hypothetical protein DL89DRAFT_263798 [Linderina pennispora]
MASAADCSGNQSMCPNGVDGVSSTYLQCDSWSGTWQTQSCVTGQVCYANPNKPGTAMCGFPGASTQKRNQAPNSGNTNARQCNGNESKCPNGADGVSATYWQCDNWSGTWQTQTCANGQVCYANPNKPGTTMCGMPGTGGNAGAGQCAGNTAKCVSAGQTGDYLQCESWSGQFKNAACQGGLKCYNNAASTGVYCN